MSEDDDGRYIMQTAILKTAAVMILLYSAFLRPSKSTPSTKVLLSVIIGVLYIYWTKAGIEGVAFSFYGILAATAGVIACHIVTRMTAGEYLTTAAIGAITGPIGMIFIILIVFTMNTIQKISGNETTETKERFIRQFAENKEAAPQIDEHFGMTIAEINLLMKSDTVISAPGGSCAASDRIDASSGKIFPWGIKLAFATLTILISGVFL
ncbi:MAG: hypothetical protein JW746_10880 [Candidatus Krumholzibacteriota bacterium]|nr:hypothetical protein [Candidatus Krumholzibacteriota bacterium]